MCPLLFREKMLPFGRVGPSDSKIKRPVYRYIFSCPGQAQALVSFFYLARVSRSLAFFLELIDHHGRVVSEYPWCRLDIWG